MAAVELPEIAIIYRREAMFISNIIDCFLTWHRREYYNIVSANSSLALDAGQNQCCTRILDNNSTKQVWELQKPVVSVPAGWLRLQNVASGHLLSQTYPSLPPLSIAMTVQTSSSSTYRETWATQWAFV